MKYKELPIKWKKEAELMERNYCNVMLEEIEKESGIKHPICIGVEEIVMEQLQENDYMILNDKHSGNEYLERIV